MTRGSELKNSRNGGHKLFRIHKLQLLIKNYNGLRYVLISDSSKIEILKIDRSITSILL